jgi:hypothetical protein
MTLMGKILTVLILVMSIFFMAFAVMTFATHKKWKEIATNTDTSAGKPLGLKQQLEAERVRTAQLQQQVDSVKLERAREQAARRHALAALQSEKAAMEMALATAQKQLGDLQAQATAASAALDRATATLADLTAEVQKSRTDIVTIQKDRDDKLKRAVALNDEINAAMGKLTLLEERHQQLVAMTAEQKKVMDRFGIAISTPIEMIPPKVDGKVTKVNGNRIQLSLGLDDGLRSGHTLEVYRGSKYLGKVRVTTTIEANKSVAEIMREFQKAQIQEGDSVATKLD